MGGIHITSLTKSFSNRRILGDLTLEVSPGTLLGLLGESGSGKTTLMRAIAGLCAIDGGRIEIGGTLVQEKGFILPPERRGVGIVFQDLALWPHMTVRENVAFPLRGDRDRADAILDEVRIGEGRDRHPHQISGGEKQRVALARALARDPRVILLDEPFSDIQRALRDDLISLVRDIARRREAAVIHATHNPEEALAFADRIGILQDGRIVQEGPPSEIYDHPVNPEVARLVGEMGVIRGARIDADRVRTSLGEVKVPPGEGDVAFGIRPEALWIREDGTISGRVRRLRYEGARTLYEVEVNGERLWGSGDGDHREGDPVRLRVDLTALRPFGEAP